MSSGRPRSVVGRTAGRDGRRKPERSLEHVFGWRLSEAGKLAEGVWRGRGSDEKIVCGVFLSTPPLSLYFP